MDVFSYKACKALFLALVVKKVKVERVEHCIDPQSSCLGSELASYLFTCSNVSWQFLTCINIPFEKLTPFA